MDRSSKPAAAEIRELEQEIELLRKVVQGIRGEQECKLWRAQLIRMEKRLSELRHGSAEKARTQRGLG